MIRGSNIDQRRKTGLTGGGLFSNGALTNHINAHGALCVFHDTDWHRHLSLSVLTSMPIDKHQGAKVIPIIFMIPLACDGKPMSVLLTVAYPEMCC
jgi:hypothetical protein